MITVNRLSHRDDFPLDDGAELVQSEGSPEERDGVLGGGDRVRGRGEQTMADLHNALEDIVSESQ